MWRKTRCSMLHRIKAYNTFITTLTSYVDQLVIQPKEVTHKMCAHMRTIVGGVCGWTTPQTLPYLKANFNFPLATRMPEAYNFAAGARVWTLLPRVKRHHYLHVLAHCGWGTAMNEASFTAQTVRLFSTTEHTSTGKSGRPTLRNTPTTVRRPALPMPTCSARSTNNLVSQVRIIGFPHGQPTTHTFPANFLPRRWLSAFGIPPHSTRRLVARAIHNIHSIGRRVPPCVVARACC